VPAIWFVFALDFWIIPAKTKNELIVSYSEVVVKRKNSKELLGYNFFTSNGYVISTQKDFIDENVVQIKITPIFKNIVSVKSQIKDYSQSLNFGTNGIVFYLGLTLLISSIIGICYLKFDEYLTDNGYLNIVIFNSWIFILFIYFFFILL
jgi:hypothetical protein